MFWVWFCGCNTSVENFSSTIDKLSHENDQLRAGDTRTIKKIP